MLMWLTRLHIIVLTAFILSQGTAVAAEESIRGVQVIMKDPPVVLRTLYEKSWAVVVGVNQYPTGGRNYPNLNFAVSDAKRVAEKLEGMGFEVRLLTDRDANRQNIIHALADDVGLKAKDHDRIIFYFAGHGATRQKVDDTNMGYILPHDYDVNRHNATAISVQQLRDISSEIKAKHMLYLMDSCFSGGLLASRGQVPQLGATGFKYLTQISQTRAHVVITAGGKDETVKEDAGSGVFTRVFLDALEKESGMPWSREGYLTAMDLASHIKKRVPELSSQQTPQYGSIDGEGDVVLSIFKPLDVSGGDERSHRVYDAERALQAEEALMRAKKKRNIAAPGF